MRRRGGPSERWARRRTMLVSGSCQRPDGSHRLVSPNTFTDGRRFKGAGRGRRSHAGMLALVADTSFVGLAASSGTGRHHLLREAWSGHDRFRQRHRADSMAICNVPARLVSMALTSRPGSRPKTPSWKRALNGASGTGMPQRHAVLDAVGSPQRHHLMSRRTTIRSHITHLSMLLK